MAVVSQVAEQATAPKRLTWRNYSGYAAGDAANNLAFSMASSFLLLYYTNVLGLGAAAIGTMFLLIRFWDALADLVVGRLVDAKKPGRLGKFRPFILYFSLPLLLSSMVLFSAGIFFPNLSPTGGLIFVYILYTVMGTLYSFVNIPYGSISPAMTQVPVERARLASWRVWGSNLTILMLAFVVAPQIKQYAKDPPDYSSRCLSQPRSSWSRAWCCICSQSLPSKSRSFVRWPRRPSRKASALCSRTNRLSGCAWEALPS